MQYRTYVGVASPLPLQLAASEAWADEEHVEIFRKMYKKNFKLAYDILGTDIKKVQNSKIFNFFPNQATQTVRLEEAILGILSIINILNYN